MMKNVFYFTLKTFFILKTFKLFSAGLKIIWEMTYKKAKINFKFMTVSTGNK